MESYESKEEVDIGNCGFQGFAELARDKPSVLFAKMRGREEAKGSGEQEDEREGTVLDLHVNDWKPGAPSDSSNRLIFRDPSSLPRFPSEISESREAYHQLELEPNYISQDDRVIGLVDISKQLHPAKDFIVKVASDTDSDIKLANDLFLERETNIRNVQVAERRNGWVRMDKNMGRMDAIPEQGHILDLEVKDEIVRKGVLHSDVLMSKQRGREEKVLNGRRGDEEELQLEPSKPRYL